MCQQAAMQDDDLFAQQAPQNSYARPTGTKAPVASSENQHTEQQQPLSEEKKEQAAASNELAILPAQKN
jgi:hypothetical protein